MKDSNTENIERIFDEAPAARKALLDNHSNLNKVADYCEKNYLNVGDTRKAVEESKALTTQALASVAYQINTLATSVLKLLDAQAIQLKQMESTVNLLTMTVDMYKEKVARQEIGLLTTSCKIPSTEKIVPPQTIQGPILEYEHLPISYDSLDSLGHGCWDANKAALKKEAEKITTIQQPSSHEGPHLSGASAGIAVPPPSVPNWPGFRTAAPQTYASPQPPTSATPISFLPQPLSFYTDTTSPSPPPCLGVDIEGLPPPPPVTSSPNPPPPSDPTYRDSFLPPFPSPQSEFMSLPPPPSPSPPPPPPPDCEGLPLPLPPPTPQNAPRNSPSSYYYSHSTVRGHVPPPPPPRLDTCPGGLSPPPPTSSSAFRGSSLTPPPPPQQNTSITPPPPPPGLPPPPPPVKGHVPPPPPPPQQNTSITPPPPPPAPPPPPPAPPSPGKGHLPPPPPPPPPF
ncbi:hypothetical protein P4O66_001419 [Electrophorus voltai]|uniref:Abl-interactor homeo-domain homologous domain-containing protein n=1 Tax=Electrophorus voltai TaxID=2609070 RepID=A0AAD8Z8R7_9TELE|nr:hypothetical protein P4O66_001419 [Electrophorus voltai]